MFGAINHKLSWKVLLSSLGCCALNAGCRSMEETPTYAANRYRSSLPIATVFDRLETSRIDPPRTIILASATTLQPSPTAPTKGLLTAPLAVPPGLPGAEAVNPRLPPDSPKTRPERLKAIEALFPELPDIGPDPLVDGIPGTRSVGVEELIELARKASPLIAQAAADIEISRGQLIQVGLYPNPTSGFRGDQILDGGPYGQFGGYFTQAIPLSGRLRLARAVAAYDLANAQLRMRKVEIDLSRQVRSDFYAALVAAENVRVNRLIAEFSGEVFRRQLELVRTGAASTFEASALRAVQGQARVSLIQSRNRYTSAWKQLAATLNAPDMIPAPLAGRVDAPLPQYRYEALRDHLLANHTEIAVARNSSVQAERSLAQERRKPIPDLQNDWYFQDDTLLKSFQFGATIGMQIPLYDRNQGGIMSAKARMTKASREVERVRNDLLRQLADAFERYETGREQLAIYREQILPDLVRAFRGAYERYQVEPDKVGYGDIVAAERNLDAQLSNYLTALQQQWTAVADLTGLVQADNLYELSQAIDQRVPECLPSVLPDGK